MKIEQLFKIREVTLEPRLMSRDLADIVFSRFEDNIPSKIEVDFQEIAFISRSFADQFHKNKLTFFKDRCIEIIVVNCNEEVFKMFQEVARTNDPTFSRSYRKSRYNVTSIRSGKDLEQLNFSF